MLNSFRLVAFLRDNGFIKILQIFRNASEFEIGGQKGLAVLQFMVTSIITLIMSHYYWLILTRDTCSWRIAFDAMFPLLSLPLFVRVQRVKLVTLYKPGPWLICLLVDGSLSRLALGAITNKK